MTDQGKAREQLIDELNDLRAARSEDRILLAELESRVHQYTAGQLADTTDQDGQAVQRLALQRVREEVWQMRSATEIDHVMEAQGGGLEAVGVRFLCYGINVIDESTNPPTVRSRTRDREGSWLVAESRVHGRATGGALEEIWKTGKALYRPDLAEEDIHGIEEDLSKLAGTPVRSLIDVPFSHGTLAVNSVEANAFSEREIAFLHELAGTLSDGFRRMADLGALEQRNRELEEEIAERKLAQEALLQSSRLIALGEMAAGMAHELKQPLTVISALAEGSVIRLDRGLEMSPEFLRDSADDTLRAVARMHALIEHLRLFSRDSSTRPAEEVALDEVIDGALTMTGAQLRSRGIEVAVDLADDLQAVLGDSFRLEQVLLNLISNARDALEERQSRPRDPERDWAGRLTIRTRPENGNVVVEVEDNGNGIGEEDGNRLFEPFFTTKTPDKGTGLGLSITYAIVKDHGGEIECDSQVGEGTTFRVRLPAVL